MVSFDYNFHGYHAHYAADAYLAVFYETYWGTQTIVLVNEDCNGVFEFTGSVEIPVFEGGRFGVIAGGSNYDSISWLQGQVDISNFSGPRLFDNDTRLEHWIGSGMVDGETWTDPSSGPADQAAFSYEVDRSYSGDGVPFGITHWAVWAEAEGYLRFDYDYTGDHRTTGAWAYLAAYSMTDGGLHTVVLVDEPTTGEFAFSGSVILPVQQGMERGFSAGGGNSDSDSRIDGVVTISGFRIATCLADFNGDGAVNTMDVLRFLNAWSSREPAADFNQDGYIDTRDVLNFLNAWIAGC